MEKAQTIPVIISTTGTIPKDLLKNIKLLGLNEHLYKAMQEAVLLATFRSVRKIMGDTPAFQITRRPDNLESAPTELNSFEI